MVFLDTNVLVYATLDQDARKRSIANLLLDEVLRKESGVVSLQVLREFANVLFRKSDCDVAEVRRILSGFRGIPRVAESEPILDRGLEIKDRHGIPFYDALIVASAEAAGCDTLYSEDLADGAVYGSVRVVNPFVEKREAPKAHRLRKRTT